jgi:hypothetical protein
MRCVLVLGAGASRYLGSDSPLPLMNDWAQALRDELNEQETGLADAIGLKKKINGEDFETTLGELFRWRSLRGLNARFRDLGSPAIGHQDPRVVEAQALERQRLKMIMTAINVTLFRLFSAASIDDTNAVEAYRHLLGVLGEPDDLVVVTTNYDPAAEIALSGLGRWPDTGFVRPPGRPPTLEPEGLIARSTEVPNAVGVLHLHGAVGWYEKKGKVFEHHQHLPFDSSNGRPVVLYPDPDKDPTRDALVQALWDEFDLALRGADYAVVIGHSLHDPALVATLRQASQSMSVAIGQFGAPSTRERLTFSKGDGVRVKALLPEAMVFPIRFGPPEVADLTFLQRWVEQLRLGD